MFEIYSHEFELKGQKYLLRPAPGAFIVPVYSLSTKLKDDEALSALSDKDFEAMRVLALETFKASYPQEDVKKLEVFVSQNLIYLLEPVLKANMATADF